MTSIKAIFQHHHIPVLGMECGDASGTTMNLANTLVPS